MSDRSRIGVALVLSAALHAWLLLVGAWAPREPRSIAASEAPLEVALVDLPPIAPPEPPAAEPAAAAPAAPAEAMALPESRVVPMPEAGQEIPSAEARFLSDRDNVVAEEMVRRGEALDRAGQDSDVSESSPDAQPEAKPQAMVEAPVAAESESEPAPPPVERAAVEPARAARHLAAAIEAPGGGEGVAQVPASEGRAIALADLMPRPGELAAAAPAREAPVEPHEPALPPRGGRNLMPGRRLRFSSGSGISVALPSVRDGDVTLLNTKAHEFAPFVRRVATRVFQHLQIQLFDAARKQVSGSGEELALVRATMSADGRFLHARLIENRSDTRLGVPRMLLNVVEPRTFFDDNPPPGAVAEDGLIHFDLTIHLRVWSEDYRDPSSARRVPLTQFEGYFGTGLR